MTTREKSRATDPSATGGRRAAERRAEQTFFDRVDYAKRLQEQTVACRIRHEKLGVRRALERDQVREAAEVFEAEPRAISASKRIIDTTHPAYRKCVEVRRTATQYWQDQTVPYPEPSVRLLRKSQVDPFVHRMNELKGELAKAAEGLQEAWEQLREQARQELGELFCEDDYPEDVSCEFALEWDFPAIQPPEYLKRVHPELYAAEQARIQARFAEAVALTEQQFVQRFHEVVEHLVDRLTGGMDGKPKTFRASTVENLNEFFAEFRRLDIGSSQQLSQLVDRAERALGGATAEELRDNAAVSANLAARLGEISKSLDSMMVDRPKRAIRLDDDAPAGGASKEAA